MIPSEISLKRKLLSLASLIQHDENAMADIQAMTDSFRQQLQTEAINFDDLSQTLLSLATDALNQSPDNFVQTDLLKFSLRSKLDRLSKTYTADDLTYWIAMAYRQKILYIQTGGKNAGIQLWQNAENIKAKTKAAKTKGKNKSITPEILIEVQEQMSQDVDNLTEHLV